MFIGQRVTRQARRPHVNRARGGDLARISHDDRMGKLKVMKAGRWLSALQRTSGVQFVFRDNRTSVRARDPAFDEWFARGATAMPFGHAALH